MLLNKKSPDTKSHHKKSPDTKSHHKKSPDTKSHHKKSHHKKSHRKKSRMISIKELTNVNILKFFNFFDKRLEWLEKKDNIIKKTTNSFFICLLFLKFMNIEELISNEYLKNKNVLLNEYSIENSLTILNNLDNFVIQQTINNFIDVDSFINFFKKNLDINSFTLVQFFNDNNGIKKYYIIGLNKDDNLFIYEPFENEYLNISLHYDEFVEIISMFIGLNIFLKSGLDKLNFVNLCNANIMSQDIDSVVQKVHLNYDDCNIFLIGEFHKKHEDMNRISINDMLKNIAGMNSINNGDMLKIDLLIEMFPSMVLEEVNTTPNQLFQINDVRNTFKSIIKNKQFNSFFAHWCDPFNVSKNDKNYDDFPAWLKKANLYINTAMSKGDYSITSEIYTWIDDVFIKKFFDPFKNHKDLFKLLTGNKIFIKQLNKANKSNPEIFKLEKFQEILLDIFVVTTNQVNNSSNIDAKYKNYHIIFCMIRTLMDFYTITRIASKNLKNVIFYGGVNHSERIMYILIKYFKFNVINENIDVTYPLLINADNYWLPKVECRKFY